MIDKSTMNLAVLMDFLKDTNIDKGTEYPWLGSAFYFGYLAATPIQSWFIQKLPLAKYLSTMVILWGIVLTCHVACSNFSKFVAVRFFLGLCEAPIYPSVTLLTGRFYTRHEQVSRVVCWYSMNGLAFILGGAAAYGILIHPPSVLNMWKELFLIFGVITVAFGVMSLYARVKVLTQRLFTFFT